MNGIKTEKTTKINSENVRYIHTNKCQL